MVTCLQPATVAAALGGVDTVYYLVHSMSSSRPFDVADRAAALAFGKAAREAGVSEDRLPRRSRSRRRSLRTWRPVRKSVRSCAPPGVPTIEFRASIVIGSGSASFEMIRALVEKLPVMVTPRWVRVRAQPIAIEDVLAYLLAALERVPDGGELFEIGGADQVTYLDLMQEYASPARVPPDDNPRAGAHAAPLEPLALARDAGLRAESAASSSIRLKNETVVEDDRALRAFRVRPRGIHDAIARALAFEDRDDCADAVVGRGVRREAPPSAACVTARASSTLDPRPSALPS